MKKDYTYSAFISYSSKDEKVAIALWKKLEHYRLPTVLQKQYEDVPEKMHIFLDQGDIVPGDTVENALSRELADSKKLIVICSPNSAVSPYVELEVKNFLSLGHSPNDIIPYIIEGEVNRESSDNCYVPSLFGKTGKDTINGVSVLRDGKWKAFVGVLANILDVKFDEIYKREKVRKNRIIAAWSGLGFLIVCLMSLIIWYVLPHTRYYCDYITKWGIPVGIFEISKNDAKKELEHYEITTRYGRPVKLVHADNHFEALNQSHYLNFLNRPKIATYEYKNGILPFESMKDWKLSSAFYTINSGDLQDGDKDYSVILEYNSDSENENQVIVDFYYGKGTRERKSLSNNYLDGSCFFYSDVRSLLVDNGLNNYSPEIYYLTDVSTIYQFRISYNEDGFDEITHFYNYNGSEVCDKNSIKEIKKYFDNLGRIIKQDLRYDSPDITLPKGIAYKYDGKGHLFSLRFLEISESNDDSACIINSNVNYAFYDYKFSSGRETISFFDSDNNPIVCSSFNGYKGESFIIDDKTSEIRTWRNELDELYPNTDVYEKIITSIDKNTTEFTTYLVINNQETKQNYLAEKRINETKKELYSISYDLYDNENSFISVEETEYIDGMRIEKTSIPINDSESIFIQSKTYDLHERLISEKQSNLFEFDGSLIECVIEYKGDNRSISFLKDGQPYLNPFRNYAQANFIYNNNNQLISCDFKDTNNFFINSYLGFSHYEAKYNINGLKLMEKYLNPKNELVLSEYFEYAQYYAEESFNHKYLTYFKYMDEDGRYAKPINKQYTHMKSDIVDNEQQLNFYSFDTKKRTDFYNDNILYKRGLYGYHADSSDIYYLDGEGRFAGSRKFNKYGELIKKRDIEYTDKAQIVKNYSTSDFSVIDNEMIKYFDGNNDYKSYYSSGNIHQLMKKDSCDRIILHEDWLENGQKETTSVFTYKEDGSYIVNTHDYTDETDSMSYYDKNKKTINGPEGYNGIGYGFDEDGIKRKVVLKADENGNLSSLSNMSGIIVKVMDVIQDSQAQKLGVLKDDIILEWGKYSYFPTGSEAELNENVEKGKSENQKIVFYRPDNQSFYSIQFNAGTKGIMIGTVYAGNSIEKSEEYINKIQIAYKKFKKKNR